MNPQDPLAALHPLRLPAVIGWWPPAPGWWALLVVLVLGLVLAAYLVRRRYLRNAYRRRALRKLRSAQQAYVENGDASHYLGAINTLLKTVALLAYPRSEVASAHGEKWRSFLNSSLPEDLQLQSVFDDAGYRRDCADVDLAKVQRAAEHWIRQHRAAR